MMKFRHLPQVLTPPPARRNRLSLLTHQTLHSFSRMLWPPRRRCGRSLFVFATIVSILITFLIYNVLEELPMNSYPTSGRTVTDKWKNRDVEERGHRLEEHIFGKAYVSKNQGVTQRLETLEHHTKNSGKPGEEECQVPQDWLFPFCESKIQFMKKRWGTNAECYVKRHKLKPENLCSVIIYLSEVERFCPLLPWRQKNNTSTKEPKFAEMRFELDQTFIDTLNKLNLRWMRDRITRMWPQWAAAAKLIAAEGSLRRKYHLKKILIFFGSYALQPIWLDLAYNGAPLGEMVQWSDLIAALYILGHDVTLSVNATTYQSYLSPPKSRGCSDVFEPEFDLIYTDYNGLTHMRMHIVSNMSPYLCRVRILDSFGTEAQFNYEAYGGVIPGEKASWGQANVNLRQIMTMFPHSPDNLFLGFVVDEPIPEDAKPMKKKPIGLVYGKEVEFWKGKREYLDTLHKNLEIHGTYSEMSEKDIKENVPEYVIAHGILSKPDLEKLLQETKVFIGLGFQYEGPAPLEAIAQGCIFLNAKFDPPHNRLNTGFFKDKPTLRNVTSQHPYAEVFIGKPHVFTVDISNLSQVEEAVKEILKIEVKPYLPREWTHKGMLERVNAFTEYHNFCEHVERWPPSSEMTLVMGAAGKSCVEVCKERELLCEPTFFVDVNTEEDLQRFGMKCTSVETKESLIAPSYDVSTQTCTLQGQPVLFACVAKEPSARRLCPCRDFQTQQVAFCKQCH